MYHGVSCKYMVHKHDDLSVTWYLSEYHGSTIWYITFCNGNFAQLNISTEMLHLSVCCNCPRIFKYIFDLGCYFLGLFATSCLSDDDLF